MVGDHVLFKGKEFIIIYKYSNDYCEIQEKRNKYHYELAPLSDLEKIYLTPSSVLDPKSKMIEV
jgi:hypothetical protein